MSDRNMGLLINIEAIDRGGKTTQIPLVIDQLRAHGVTTATISFPDTPRRHPGHDCLAHFATGVLIERDLDGRLPLIDLRDGIFRRPAFERMTPEEREEIVAIIQEKLVQVLYSVNRRERHAELLAALREHDVVLVSRYLSAWTYGVDGGVSRLQLVNLEGDLLFPDLTILLDLDPEDARARRDDQLDRYERDLAKQRRIRARYNDLVREDAIAAEAEGRLPRFARVDASGDIASITAEITALILDRLAAVGVPAFKTYR